MKGFAPTSAIDRLFARLEWQGECLVFPGAHTVAGYGLLRERVNGERTMTGTHCVMYRDTIGPIPDGLFVLHTCDNPPCCNPDHLWLGTAAENSLDMVTKGRARGYMTGSTVCRKGLHQFTPDNTYTFPDGRRLCRECHRENQREYRARKVSA